MKPRKPTPRWLIEKNKLRTDTAKEDRKALTEELRRLRAKRRGEE